MLKNEVTYRIQTKPANILGVSWADRGIFQSRLAAIAEAQHLVDMRLPGPVIGSKESIQARVLRCTATVEVEAEIE